MDDLAGDANSAEEEDWAGDVDPAADCEDSAGADSAGGLGGCPAGQDAPAGSQMLDQQGQVSVMLSEDVSVIFSTLPRWINQASLLDFMSMMTLMQRHMDTVMPVPDNQDRPTIETPGIRDSQTPTRRSKTPVRRCREMDESRSST